MMTTITPVYKLINQAAIVSARVLLGDSPRSPFPQPQLFIVKWTIMPPTTHSLTGSQQHKPHQYQQYSGHTSSTRPPHKWRPPPRSTTIQSAEADEPESDANDDSHSDLHNPVIVWP